MGLTRVGGNQLSSTSVSSVTDADLNSIAAFSDLATGFLRKVSANTWVLETTVVSQVAGRTGNITLTQNDIGNLTVNSSPTFSSVSASTFTGNLTGQILSSSQPVITTVGSLTSLTSTGVVNVTNNTAATELSTGALQVAGGSSISGNVIVGQNINIAKTQGLAIQIDGGYGWRDLIGDMVPKTTGANVPTLRVLRGAIREFSYAANDTNDIKFHIPHDYAPGTDIYLHAHWTHNGTNISGSLIIDYSIMYAKGHNQAVFSSPVSTSLTVGSLTIANSPQYIHRIDEIKISTAGGSSSMLNTTDLEVDGFVLVNFVTSTIPSITGSAISNTPYIITIDIHYQSTGLTTKNRVPNFYV